MGTGIKSADGLLEYLELKQARWHKADLVWYVHEICEEVAETHVRLPKDSEDKYVALGDDMETLLKGFEGQHSRVEILSLTADGWEVDGDSPKTMRHYRKPTTESVLKEFLAEYERDDTELSDDEIIGVFAKRLRVRED